MDQRRLVRAGGGDVVLLLNLALAPCPNKKFYLTTPIYYVNARPHIGHAYTTIAADVIARRHRLLGDDTFLLTGTDEHGQKVERSAAAAGVSPQQFADQVSASFKALWDRMGITYDDYIRTTEPRHTQGVQKLFQDLVDRGAIYLSTYTGQYSVGEEIFVEGPPGVLGPDGKPTETVTEENFFFRLSEYQLPLIDLIESDTLLIQPESRKNEILSFLRGNVAEATDAGTPTAISKLGNPYVPGNLRDLSVSRSSFTWGIPVPEPAASQTKQKHVIYVWLDALANYMTAVGYGSDDPARQEQFKRYWPADLHIMGKEITRQHCIYWPAFLLAADLPLPKAVTAHGWLLFEDSKMSKSRGNIVRTETILDAFGTLKPKPLDGSWAGAERRVLEARTGPLCLRRYALFSPARDSFRPGRELQLRCAGAALQQRSRQWLWQPCQPHIDFDRKSSAGVVEDCIEANSLVYYQPERKETHNHPANDELLSATEGQALGWTLVGTHRVGREELRQNFFAEALTTIAAAIAKVDQFLTSRRPWAATETELSQEGRRSTLYTAAESIRIITALLYPVLPYATAKVWAQLGLGDIEQAAKNGELKNLEWGGLKPGTKLGDLGPIFPRAPKELIQVMADMETPSAPAPKFVGESTTNAKPDPTDSSRRMLRRALRIFVRRIRARR